jgi:LmbE family N-acetylglucosaminyl deacetylase
MRHRSKALAALNSPRNAEPLGTRLLKRGVHGIRALHAGAVTRWLVHSNSQTMHVSSASAMVFAPHQDDETFGCGGLIALKRELGARVVIVFLTNGQNSHRTRPHSPNSLVAIREEEALSAAHQLGVPCDCVHFLGFPDSQLTRLSIPQREHVLRSLAFLIEQYRPAEVYVPHRHDQLADHEATYHLVRDCLRGASTRPQVFQYPIWLVWLAPLWLQISLNNLRGAFALPIASVLAKKRLAIAAYQSQLQILPSGFLSRFAIPFEVFFSMLGNLPVAEKYPIFTETPENERFNS